MDSDIRHFLDSCLCHLLAIISVSYAMQIIQLPDSADIHRSQPHAGQSATVPLRPFQSPPVMMHGI